MYCPGNANPCYCRQCGLIVKKQASFPSREPENVFLTMKRELAIHSRAFRFQPLPIPKLVMYFCRLWGEPNVRSECC